MVDRWPSLFLSRQPQPPPSPATTITATLKPIKHIQHNINQQNKNTDLDHENNAVTAGNTNLNNRRWRCRRTTARENDVVEKEGTWRETTVMEENDGSGGRWLRRMNGGQWWLSSWREIYRESEGMREKSHRRERGWERNEIWDSFFFGWHFVRVFYIFFWHVGRCIGMVCHLRWFTYHHSNS